MTNANAIDTVLDHAVTLMDGHDFWGSVTALFSPTGAMETIRKSPGDFDLHHPDVFSNDQVRALEAFLLKRQVFEPLQHLAPMGTTWQFWDGGIVVRARLKGYNMFKLDLSGHPLGGRILQASTGTRARAAKVLGDLAKSMEPGTDMIVAEESMSMHARLQMRALAPGMEDLVEEMFQENTRYPFPMRLHRFSACAVLSDPLMDRAWMAV